MLTLVSLDVKGETMLAAVTTGWPMTSLSNSDPPDDEATAKFGLMVSIGFGLSAEGVLAKRACKPGDSCAIVLLSIDIERMRCGCCWVKTSLEVGEVALA